MPKWQKRGNNPQFDKLRAAVAQRLRAAALNCFLPKKFSFLMPTYFCTCGQLLLVAPAHAHLPKLFLKF
jgi:hypothetical protein